MARDINELKKEERNKKEKEDLNNTIDEQIEQLQNKINLNDNAFVKDQVIINPGALAHYSYSIRDAIASISKPTVEVHLTDIYNREPFRNKSVVSDACIEVICGKGKNGYLEALKLIESN